MTLPRGLPAASALCGLISLLVLLCAVRGAPPAFAQRGDRTPIDTTPPPAHWKVAPAPVLTPEGSIARMEIAPGFRVEVVAAEPLVQDPIAFSFAPDGRLWVLEWPAYNWGLRDGLPGLDDESPPPSRVVVLDDTNGDGMMDTRTVFAEVGWPRGILAVDGGVLVFDLPDVVVLRDTTGDGRADRREVLFSGLGGVVNPHSAPSSPAWAVDNWVYSLQTETRARYARGRWHTTPAGRLGGQWGLSQDDYGRLFFGYNGDHLRGSLVPIHYAARNPNYAARGGIDVRLAPDQTVWPHAITAGVNRRVHLREDGRLEIFTANAGPSVYRSDHFPPEFHGDVFLAESAGRFIRRTVLSEENGVITGRNAYDGREFLFSHDERFRPVFTAAGPDGALYVADMYRGIIETYISVTTFLRTQIVDRGLQHPFHGMGRIYRIRRDDRPLGTRPAVRAGDTAGWVPHLAHPDGFWRDAAQRAIVAAGDRSLVPALRDLAASHSDGRVRLHALWALDGLGAADEAVVGARLGDQSPQVRAAALRLAEPFLDSSATRHAVLALVKDEDLVVRRQLLFTLGASTAPDAESAMLAILARDGGEPFIVDAALSGLAGREDAVLQRVLSDPGWTADRPAARPLVTALATAVTNSADAERVDRVLQVVVEDTRPLWHRQAVLDGVEAAAVKHLRVPPRSLAQLRAVDHPELRQKALTVVGTFTLSAGAAAADSAPTSPALERGRAAYAICAACHQPDGRGLEALAPSLHGTPRVTGPPEILIDTILNGRDEDPKFPSMPPLAGMPDEQIAAILTYIRQAWNNAATPISAEQVRARRKAP